MIPFEVLKSIKEYEEKFDKIWKYITELENFSKDCKCENLDSRDTFDSIDYTGDNPEVRRWCLRCGGVVG
jgi:hypothetical protein